MAAEVLGGLLLIAGLQTRIVSLALVPILVGSLWVHSGNGWLFSSANGGWEYSAFLTIAAFAQALLGDGAYSLSAIFGTRNDGFSQRASTI
jgi:putative oxidoreductase